MDTSVLLPSAFLEMRQPSVILEVEEGNLETQYLGFAMPGTVSFSENKFAVLRIQKNTDTGITTMMWSNGSLTRDCIFDDAQTLDYQLKK